MKQLFQYLAREDSAAAERLLQALRTRLTS